MLRSALFWPLLALLFGACSNDTESKPTPGPTGGATSDADASTGGTGGTPTVPEWLLQGRELGEACDAENRCKNGLPCVAPTDNPDRPLAYSQHGTCYQACIGHGECPNKCCFKLQGLDSVCAPADVCPEESNETSPDASVSDASSTAPPQNAEAGDSGSDAP